MSASLAPAAMSPNAACVPGTGVRPWPGFQAQKMSESCAMCYANKETGVVQDASQSAGPRLTGGCPLSPEGVSKSENDERKARKHRPKAPETARAAEHESPVSGRAAL